MSESEPILSEELHHYLLEQQRELQALKEQFDKHYQTDEFIKKSFQSFINHKIDDITASMSEYLEKNSRMHHMTPKEIDQILYFVMRSLQSVASLESKPNETEPLKAKMLILNWVRLRIFHAQKPKESKVKVLCELLRQYAISDRFEKAEIYSRIKFYLNQSAPTPS